MSFWPNKEASRKFVDLINRATSQYVNWDSSITFEVGDYGTLDRTSGEFVKEGNIYREEAFAELVAQIGPVVGESANLDYAIHLQNAEQLEPRNEKNAGSDPGLPDAAFKGQWKFNASRGAVLVMLKPRLTRIPDEIFPLTLQNRKLLNDKKLITEVSSCPAYALYFSGNNSETVSIGSEAQTQGFEAGWTTEGMSGVFLEGHGERASFTPLFRFREIRALAGIRRASPIPSEDDFWGDVEVPWSFLDEDGEEEEFDEYIVSDDSDSDSD